MQDGNKIKINIEDELEPSSGIDKNTSSLEEGLEKVADYEFLDNTNHNNSNEDIITNQFDEAFKKASPVIQDYILGDKLEENVRLICKIEKLDEEKARVVVENIVVSILVGLLPIDEAKNTMIDSFRSSGILLEAFTAGLLLKNIDAYILSDIRKQILENKLEKNKEIRHLTLKEKNEEKEKEELRKILLERTGNLTGKGEIIIQYKNRESSSNKSMPTQEAKKDFEVTRESLLAKINLQNVSDTEKVKDRMIKIKEDEEERLNRLKAKTQKEAEERLGRIQIKEAEQDSNEILVPEKQNPDFNENISKEFAKSIEEKLESEEDKNTNLDELRKQRGESETKNKTLESSYYSSIKDDNNTDNLNTKSFDPYRESL